ncbi:MAG: hypothetical protein D6816_08345 [Bacteroidetes bacterium]|nr:MAG: hypothetical protein D6816_08345 [Bacteroidota bacterium]
MAVCFLTHQAVSNLLCSRWIPQPHRHQFVTEWFLRYGRLLSIISKQYAINDKAGQGRRKIREYLEGRWMILPLSDSGQTESGMFITLQATPIPFTIKLLRETIYE